MVWRGGCRSNEILFLERFGSKLSFSLESEWRVCVCFPPLLLLSLVSICAHAARCTHNNHKMQSLLLFSSRIAISRWSAAAIIIRFHEIDYLRQIVVIIFVAAIAPCSAIRGERLVFSTVHSPFCFVRRPHCTAMAVAMMQNLKTKSKKPIGVYWVQLTLASTLVIRFLFSCMIFFPLKTYRQFLFFLQFCRINGTISALYPRVS